MPDVDVDSANERYVRRPRDGAELGNLAWFGPSIAAALLFIGYRFWQYGLQYYSSTGT